jgi:hypothetical protein
MNPLFAKFSKYVANRALQEFRASTTGSILKEIESLSRNKGAGNAKLTRLTRDLIKSAGQGSLRRAVGNTEIGHLAKNVERYAAGGFKNAALDSMFGALGPLGDVFRAFLRPRGRKLTGIQQEIEAAYNLLRVFRPDLLKQPSPIQTRIGANKPPTGRLSGTGPGRPLMTSRFEMPPDAAEAQKLLEALGFTVTPPNKKPPADTEYVTMQDGRRVALKTRGKALPYKFDDPILTGQMIKVDSSNVHSIGFIYDHDDPAQSVLKVRFLQTSRKSKDRKVPGPMYFYYRVPPEVFQRFRVAASKGKFVWDKLRIRGTVSGHQYQYDLKGIAEEYVPRKATRFGQNEYFVGRQVRVRSVQGAPMGTRESQLPDQFVRTLAPSRGRRPSSGGGGSRKLGPSGPKGPGRK